MESAINILEQICVQNLIKAQEDYKSLERDYKIACDDRDRYLKIIQEKFGNVSARNENPDKKEWVDFLTSGSNPQIPCPCKYCKRKSRI